MINEFNNWGVYKWTFSISVSHFIPNQLPQKDMYLLCTTVLLPSDPPNAAGSWREIQASYTKHGERQALRAEYKWANVHILLPPTPSFCVQFITNFQTCASTRLPGNALLLSGLLASYSCFCRKVGQCLFSSILGFLLLENITSVPSSLEHR